MTPESRMQLFTPLGVYQNLTDVLHLRLHRRIAFAPLNSSMNEKEVTSAPDLPPH